MLPMRILHVIVFLVLLGLTADAGPKYLYYKYQFENDQAEPVAADFFDSLPVGILWDRSFTPVTTGSLQVDAVAYSNANRDARIDQMLLPPGKSTLTLRTRETGKTGIIDNEATLTPEGAPEPLNAEASIELDPDFFETPLEGDVLLVLDASGSMITGFADTTRFDRVIQEAIEVINLFDAGKKFNVITFDGALHWSDGSNDLKLATPENKQATTDALILLQTGGSTDYEVGLGYASTLATIPEQVVFLSDGQPNEPNYLDEISTLVSLGVRVDTIGIGDISSQGPLEEMASLGGGIFRFVAQPESASP